MGIEVGMFPVTQITLHIFYLAGFHTMKGLDKEGYPSPLDVRPNGGQMYFNMQQHLSCKPYGNPEAIKSNFREPKVNSISHHSVYGTLLNTV